jgi:hypothetical protein
MYKEDSGYLVCLTQLRTSVIVLDRRQAKNCQAASIHTVEASRGKYEHCHGI